MEFRDVKWLGYCLVALLWVIVVGSIANKLPGGINGGLLVHQQTKVSDRIARPPVASTERIHVYTEATRTASVFWEQPEAGRIHFTIELPEVQAANITDASDSEGSNYEGYDLSLDRTESQN